jgi:hypothetical protein
MEFKKKLKNRIRSRCIKCGYKTKSGINATFLSWFFHDQLCDCKQGLSPPGLFIAGGSRVGYFKRKQDAKPINIFLSLVTFSI